MRELRRAGTGKGFVVDRLEIAIIAMEVVSAFYEADHDPLRKANKRTLCCSLPP